MDLVRRLHLRPLVVVLIAALVALGVSVVATGRGAHAADAHEGHVPLAFGAACNDVTVAIAKKMDEVLAAAKSRLRVLLKDTPKKGETGFSDGRVFYALTLFAFNINKKVEEVTEDDINKAANAEALKEAIEKALEAPQLKTDKFSTTTDQVGNTLQLWCLLKNADHGGPDLGLLLIRKGQKPVDGVWIGACVLPGGVNEYWAKGDKDGAITSIVWYNMAPVPNAPGTFTRITYIYDAVKKELTIIREVVKLKKDPATGKDTLEPDPTKTEKEKKPVDAPSEFKNLKLNGNKLTLLDGDCLCPTRTVAMADVDPEAPDQVGLSNPPLFGSGTPDDPFVGNPITFEPGDSLLVWLPDGVAYVGDGVDPLWTTHVFDESGVLLEYEGEEPLLLNFGDRIANVIAVAPTSSPTPMPTDAPTPMPTDTAEPTPTAQPLPSAPTLPPAPTPAQVPRPSIA